MYRLHGMYLPLLAITTLSDEEAWTSHKDQSRGEDREGRGECSLELTSLKIEMPPAGYEG